VAENKEAILTALGQLIRENRRNAGISQEELAARSGLDRTYVSGVERGVRNPSLTALLKIAKGLSLSLSMLLNGLEENMKLSK
jgi:transcriptional regulator with XRE-family HTH domain